MAGLAVLLGKAPLTASDVLALESRRARGLGRGKEYSKRMGALLDAVAPYDCLSNREQLLGVASHVVEHCDDASVATSSAPLDATRCQRR